MKNYNFKKRSFCTGPHFLGALLVLAGVVSIVSPLVIESAGSVGKTMLIGAGALLIGILMVTSYSGTVIDFDKRRAKDYFSFLGIKFGEWTALPSVEKVALISATYKATNTVNGISPTWSGDVTGHNVFIYAESPKPILSFAFDKKERALETAKTLSANFDVAYKLHEV